jgi:ketosteroid isomerase-like protein/quercetin dioxygenase-like cupin family protein
MPYRSIRHSIMRMSPVLVTTALLTPAGARAQTDEQLIRALDSTFNVAFAARDSVTLATLYAPNATGMYPNTPVATGGRAVLGSYSILWGMNAKLRGTPTSITVSKSGDLATVTGKYNLNFTGSAGPVADSGSYVETLAKGSDGKWRIVNEIVTSHVPMTASGGGVAFDTGTIMTMASASALQWGDLKVEGFPPGAKIAVVHGDPSGTADYTLRLQLPDGYRFPLHWHPNAEHLTVLSGSLTAGMGTKEDRSAEKTYAPGDFVYFPAKTPHFGGAKGATVLQLHGIGPFTINLGTP